MKPASPKNNYHYNTKLKAFANRLRKDMTKAEACLWKYVLKARQLKGYGFRRQRPVLNYFVDFMSKDLMLIIEVDGISHEFTEVMEKDLQKTKDLEAVGFTVIRFSDENVLKDIKGVSTYLEQWIEDWEERNTK